MSVCLDSLKKLGFGTQFQAIEKGLKSLKTNKMFQPEEIKIVHYYRFEGESDPSDNAILYVVETSSGEKGTLIDGYGIYYNAKVSEFVKEVEEIKAAVVQTREEAMVVLQKLSGLSTDEAKA